MSYYDKAKKRYIVRVTENGKRVLVGGYRTEEEADLAYITRKSENTPKKTKLDSVKLHYEIEDKGITWLKPFRLWQKRQYRLKEDAKFKKDLEKF